MTARIRNVQKRETHRDRRQSGAGGGKNGSDRLTGMAFSLSDENVLDLHRGDSTTLSAQPLWLVGNVVLFIYYHNKRSVMWKNAYAVLRCLRTSWRMTTRRAAPPAGLCVAQTDSSRRTLLLPRGQMQWEPSPLRLHIRTNTKPCSQFPSVSDHSRPRTAHRFLLSLSRSPPITAATFKSQTSYTDCLEAENFKNYLCGSSFLLHVGGTEGEFRVSIPFTSQSSWPRGEWEAGHFRAGLCAPLL